MTEHFHKLKRHKYKNGTEVYFCSNNCSFKVEAPFALGKIVLCNICNQPFTMNELSVRMARPHCNGCGKMRVKDENGKTVLVDKNRSKVIAPSIAANTVNDLRARLASVVTMEKDEDI